MAKISTNTGKERIMSGRISSYWYDIGPAEIQLTYPPYGDIYMKFHFHVLIHDGDPEHVSFFSCP